MYLIYDFTHRALLIKAMFANNFSGLLLDYFGIYLYHD